jgi:hypothetical protein
MKMFEGVPLAEHTVNVFLRRCLRFGWRSDLCGTRQAFIIIMREDYRSQVEIRSAL